MTVEELIRGLPPAIREQIIKPETQTDNLAAIEGFLEQGEALAATLNASDAVKETAAALFAKAQIFYMFGFIDNGDRYDDQFRHYLSRYKPGTEQTSAFVVDTDDQIFTDTELEKW